jgi:hypothetical protein
MFISKSTGLMKQASAATIAECCILILHPSLVAALVSSLDLLQSPLQLDRQLPLLVAKRSLDHIPPRKHCYCTTVDRKLLY